MIEQQSMMEALWHCQQCGEVFWALCEGEVLVTAEPLTCGYCGGLLTLTETRRRMMTVQDTVTVPPNVTILAVIQPDKEPPPEGTQP